MNSGLEALLEYAFQNRKSLLSSSEKGAKTQIYRQYNVAVSNSPVNYDDDQFAAEIKQIGEQNSTTMIYYTPMQGGGFHKFQSIMRNDRQPAVRIYIRCSTPPKALEICRFLAVQMVRFDSGMVEFKCCPPSQMFQRSDPIVAYLEGAGFGEEKKYLTPMLDELRAFYANHSDYFTAGLPHMVKQAKDANKIPMHGIGWADEPPNGRVVEFEKDNERQSFGSFYGGLVVLALHDAFRTSPAHRDFSPTEFVAKNEAIDQLTLQEITEAMERVLNDRDIHGDKPHKIHPRMLRRQGTVKPRALQRGAHVRQPNPEPQQQPVPVVKKTFVTSRNRPEDK